METIWGTTARYALRSMGNPYAGKNKMSHQTQIIGNPFPASKRRVRLLPSRIQPKRVIIPARPSVTKKSKFIEDVTLLSNNLNDKAFLYDSGKIDVIKNESIVTRKFPNKKDASLYLLKAGWQYVR